MMPSLEGFKAGSYFCGMRNAELVLFFHFCPHADSAFRTPYCGFRMRIWEFRMRIPHRVPFIGFLKVEIILTFLFRMRMRNQKMALWNPKTEYPMRCDESPLQYVYAESKCGIFTEF